MASATAAVGFGGLQSVLPAIGREIGIADSLVAAIFSLAALLVLVFSPFWARQADIRGRKPIIMIGTAGFIVSMFACALVVSAGVHRLAPPFAIFILFLLARGLSGAIGSASPPATQAFVADRTSREARTQALATLAGTAGFGSIFGPLVTPLLAQGPLGLAGPLYAFAVAGVVVLLLIGRLVPGDPPPPGAAAPRHETVELREIWNDPTVRRLLVYAALVGVLTIGATQTIGFALIDSLRLSPMQALPYITGAMMAGSASTVVGQWGLVRWFKMQPHSLLRWGPGLSAIGSVAIVASQTYALMVAGYALFCLGLSFARPGISAGASLAVDARAQAGTAGLINALMGAAPLVSPVFLLIYGWMRPAPFLLAAAVLGGLLFFALLDRRLRDFHPSH